MRNIGFFSIILWFRWLGILVIKNGRKWRCLRCRENLHYSTCENDLEINFNILMVRGKFALRLRENDLEVNIIKYQGLGALFEVQNIFRLAGTRISIQYPHEKC